jgi:hypothetical protein
VKRKQSTEAELTAALAEIDKQKFMEFLRLTNRTDDFVVNFWIGDETRSRRVTLNLFADGTWKLK